MDTQSLTDTDGEATQILENLARGGANMWRPPAGTAEPEPLLDDSLGSYPKDTSAESSDLYSAAPRHNFYDQPEHDEFFGNEDSQKENTPAPCDNKPSTPGPHPVFSSANSSKSGGKIPASNDNNCVSPDPSSRSSEHATTGLGDVSPEMTNDASRSPFKGNIPLSGPSTKLVSFMSPNSRTISSAPAVAQRRGLLPAKPRPRHPSPPASQDSFIDPLPDPAKAYIASDPQFHIPLDQLGEESQSSVTQSPARATAPDRMSLLRALRRDPSPGHSPARDEEPVVLVPATPSAASSQNSAPQELSLYPQSQDGYLYPNAQAEYSASSSQPDDVNASNSASHDQSQASEPQPWQPTQETESSQSSLEDRYQFPPSTVVATQATEYQETQVASDNGAADAEPTQVEPPSLLSEPMARSTAPSISTNATAGVTRSLLSTIPKEKLGRYKVIATETRGRGRVPEVPVAPPLSGVPEIQTAPLVATQQATSQPARDIRRRGAAPTEDSSDVVPDSEPARLARLESSPPIPLADVVKRTVNLTGREDDDSDLTEIDAYSDDDHHAPSEPSPTVVNKGKAAALAAAPEASEVQVGEKSTPENRGRGRVSRDQVKNGAVQKHKEEEVVPSSVPGEDAKAAAKSITASASGRKAAPKRRTRSKAASKTRKPKAAAKAIPDDRQSDTEADDDEQGGPPGPPKRRDAVREEEEETEPDDIRNGMQVDSQEAMPPPPASRAPSRKRKRPAAVEGPRTRAASRAPTARGSYSPSVASTVDRASKRARTATPSIRSLREPTRVFAQWNDGTYFPGVLNSHRGSGCYEVRFDDGSFKTLEVAKIRLCQLAEGDAVRVPRKAGCEETGKVVEVEGSASRSRVVVEYDRKDGNEIEDLTMADIRIAGRVVNRSWKNRMLVPNAIATVLEGPLRQTLSHSSLKSRTTNRLDGTYFIISNSSTNPHNEKHKADAVSKIKAAGGAFIDDWPSIIPIEGRFLSSGNCWVASHTDLKLGASEKLRKISRVFLLSDDCTTKPKFLMALAFGVPCLHIRWALAPGVDDWRPYLLPAGFSDTLGTRISQRVDFDWGVTGNIMKAIMDNPVAIKVFADKSILCLSDKFVPVQAGATNKIVADDRGTLACVPRIILAMGAKRVEAVTQTRNALQNLKAYDYIVVSSPSDLDTLRQQGLKVANWEWVKDCLIAGRLHNLPE
ncbi:hypothetical protein OE88DRAFT_1003892 [Heliocybe sulcata]|uniref:BRCT domain-containing protein n=1 Tax=Heliocybe sulcata TaxID=5364 RepID=A0A5C3NND8_9AGAM|nr:hypothetical protein OE88DRAFT_1003892 [Heliocybe sulcata]